jgi:hypothetical protein
MTTNRAARKFWTGTQEISFPVWQARKTLMGGECRETPQFLKSPASGRRAVCTGIAECYLKAILSSWVETRNSQGIIDAASCIVGAFVSNATCSFTIAAGQPQPANRYKDPCKVTCPAGRLLSKLAARILAIIQTPSRMLANNVGQAERSDLRLLRCV